MKLKFNVELESLTLTLQLFSRSSDFLTSSSDLLQVSVPNLLFLLLLQVYFFSFRFTRVSNVRVCLQTRVSQTRDASLQNSFKNMLTNENDSKIMLNAKFLPKKLHEMSLMKFLSVCFDRKHCIKIVFCIFLVLVTLEKIS